MPTGLSRLLDEVRDDVRFASRTLLRAPGFAVAVLSLGLAVGATTAVYGTVDWLLNRSPSGVVEPERLVVLRLTERGREDEIRYGFSMPQYERLRDVQDAFVDIAAYGKLLKVVTTDDWEAEIVFQFVSGSYFSLLGVRPHVGRLLGPEDDVDGAPPVVVLSHDLWQSHFGEDPGAIGTTVQIQGAQATVIGVLPQHYEDYSIDWNAPTGLWLPLRAATAIGMDIMLTSPTTFYPVVGRLRPGVTLDVARERAQRWVPELPTVRTVLGEPNAITVRPEREARISRRDEARSFLGALLVVCTLILLAACFNVANFVLGRASRRRREIALRSALGAGRMRVLRQLLTESALLAVATAVTAVGLGVWVASILAPLPALYLNLWMRGASLTTAGAVDARMLATAVSLAALASFVLGVVPMLQTLSDPVTALKGSGGGWGWSRFRPTWRQSVLALQVGLAVVLSVTAALYAGSFGRAARVDAEYADAESLLMVRLMPVGPSNVDFSATHAILLDRLASAPWAASAGMSSNPPYAGGVGSASLPDDPEGAFQIGGAVASPGLFETFGVPLLAGREFVEADSGVAIVNRGLAERLWPGQDPIGRVYMFSDEPVRVVGVVERERCRDLLEPPGPCAWRPTSLERGGITLNVRTVGPGMASLPQLRAIVRDLRPRVTIVEAQTLEGLVDRRLRAQRAAAGAASALALFGIVLLVVGCVSLFLSMVRESLREIAIRMALGATGARVTTTIAIHGLLVATIGLALGLLGAVLVAKRLAHQFYEIDALHLPTFIVVPAMILLAAMASVTYSARTAIRTEPAEHLHRE